jgi:hypothetical protein
MSDPEFAQAEYIRPKMDIMKKIGEGIPKDGPPVQMD